MVKPVIAKSRPFLLLIIALAVILCSGQSLFALTDANSDRFLSTETTALSSQPCLVDIGDNLAPEDRTSLAQKTSSLSAKLGCDLLLLISNQNKDAATSSEAYAKEYYSTNSYAADGLILSLDLFKQSTYIVAVGAAQERYRSDMLGTIAEQTNRNGLLQQGKYADAFDFMLKKIEEEGSPATPADEGTALGKVHATPIGGGPALIDNQNLLTPEQQEKLSLQAYEAGKKYNLDIVLVLTTNNSTKSAMVFADDVYDQGKYAVDGLLALIQINKLTNVGDIYISTTGSAMKLVPDNKIVGITDKVAEKYGKEIKAGNFYPGTQKFLDLIVDRLADTRPRLKLRDIVAACVVALLAFFIPYGSKKNRYKKPAAAKRKIDMNKQAIVDYKVISNTLVDKRVQSQVITSGNSSSGGGGGGGHISSGGVSHGGGGSKF